jgi:hypothetical protein
LENLRCHSIIPYYREHTYRRSLRRTDPSSELTVNRRQRRTKKHWTGDHGLLLCCEVEDDDEDDAEDDDDDEDDDDGITSVESVYENNPEI